MENAHYLPSGFWGNVFVLLSELKRRKIGNVTGEKSRSHYERAIKQRRTSTGKLRDLRIYEINSSLLMKGVRPGTLQLQ